jgi:hypothetical protein
MSEDQANNSVVNDDQSQASSESQKIKDEYVKLSSYEEVRSDMFKYKDGLKSERARANEAEAKLKAIQEQKLKDQEEWQKLYEQTRKEKEELEISVAQEKSNYLRSVKISALKQELGGDIKDVYLQHADLNAMEFNDDGTLSPESVQTVANKFREEHSVLIPSGSNNQITNQAPANGPAPSKDDDNDLSKMSFSQKQALLKSLKK